MFKYVRFTPLETNETTLTFRSTTEDIKVNYFDKPFVSIEADSESSIDALIASQPSEIDCQEITKVEFTILVKESLQYKRILQRANNKLEAATASTLFKYPEAERETWATQLKEAILFLETAVETDTPLLKVLADEDGITVEEFANKVIKKNSEYETLRNTALVEKRAFLKELLTKIGV